MSELKEYHFTDDQIDYLLELVKTKTEQVQYHFPNLDVGFLQELANQIEDQIVNHPTND